MHDEPTLSGMTTPGYEQQEREAAGQVAPDAAPQQPMAASAPQPINATGGRDGAGWVNGDGYGAGPGYAGYAGYQGYQSSGDVTGGGAGFGAPLGGMMGGTMGGTMVGRPNRGRGMRRSALGVVALVALALTFVAGCAIGGAQASGGKTTSAGTAPTVVVPPSAQDLQQTLINVAHTVQPSVVEVMSQSSQGEAIGSGEILTADGYIVTNDHVVVGFSTFSVRLANNAQYAAQLVGQDAQDDLAVLKVSNAGTLQPIAFGDSGKVQVGQFAIAIGSPLGLQQSTTLGIVSALDRTASEGQNGPAQSLSGLIQTSAPINPGNSGGALVDLQGRLIGIPTLGAVDPQSGSAANGIGFAIPSNRVTYVAQQLIKSGHLVSTNQGFIGIRGEDVTAQLASAYNLPVQSGVLVTGFANDAAGKSPAQQAGLQANDIITAVNGTQISSSDELGSQIQTRAPGDAVTLTVRRGSQTLQTTVTLGERPTTTG